MAKKKNEKEKERERKRERERDAELILHACSLSNLCWYLQLGCIQQENRQKTTLANMADSIRGPPKVFLLHKINPFSTTLLTISIADPQTKFVME